MPIPRLILLFAAIFAIAIGCAKKGENSSGDPPTGPPNPAPGGGSTEPRKDPEKTTPTPVPDTPEIAQRKREVTRNLQQIVLGVWNHHDVTGHLPSGLYSKNDTKLGLSWRVLILEYIEEKTLFNEFKFDEPWDSDHNKKLITRMPKCFRSGSTSDSEGKTHFRGFSGRGALFVGPRASKDSILAFGSTFASIKDGLENTLLVATLAEPIVWTKPDTLDYQDNTPLPKFGGLFDDGFHILMLDGKVRFVPNTVPEATMRAIITRDGGEKVELPGEEVSLKAGSAPPKGK